jgi:hypothetical protein
MTARTQPRDLPPMLLGGIVRSPLRSQGDRRNHASRVLVLHRVRTAFSELPPLRLTEAQSALLFGIAIDVSQRVLATLEREGFLWRGADGQYAMRAGH